MSLECKCEHCGAAAVLKYVRPGEVAKCRQCGADVTVPTESTQEPAAPPSPSPTRAAYREYIEALTHQAEVDPKGYRRRVILLVMKGYGYIFGLLLVLLLTLGVVVAIAVLMRHVSFVVVKLSVPIAVLAYVFLKALWPRVPEPQGAKIQESEAPELYGVIERIRTRLGVPRPYAVLRTADFNASIVQFPRFGFFGGYRSYVMLGLPLLEALTPGEFEAVLAHEFGHLAGQHGRFSAWIYRMRQSWGRILSQLEESSAGLDLVRGFLRKFVPEFDATTFVLARRHEYEADRAAAMVTDARTIGSALVRLELMSRVRGERFQAALSQRVAREPDPPQDIVGDEIHMFRGGLEQETARAWLKDALGQPTDLDDTHPSLTDRLAALGIDAETLPAGASLERSAAEAFAGPIREEWRREIDAKWLALNAKGWRTQNAKLTKSREVFQEWKTRAADGNLSKGEQFAYAVLILNHEGIEAAIAHLRQWVNAEPGDLRSRGMLGDLLLGRGDESGLEHVSAVVTAEPALAVRSCQWAYQWLFRRGRMKEADEWFERGNQCMAAWERGRVERRTVTMSDEFLPHGLPEEIADRIRGLMMSVKGIQGAWLVRKRLRVIPDEPIWLLVADPTWKHISFGRDGRTKRILKQMAAAGPLLEPALHVVLAPSIASIRYKLDAIESARLR